MTIISQEKNFSTKILTKNIALLTARYTILCTVILSSNNGTHESDGTHGNNGLLNVLGCSFLNPYPFGSFSSFVIRVYLSNFRFYLSEYT